MLSIIFFKHFPAETYNIIYRFLLLGCFGFVVWFWCFETNSFELNGFVGLQFSYSLRRSQTCGGPPASPSQVLGLWA